MSVQGLPPKLTQTAMPYWEALRRHEISLQHCNACARKVFYPRIRCPHCGSAELTWRRVETPATLYTFSVAEVPVSPAFAHLQRPVMAVAEIEGVHIPTTLVDVDPEQVKIGMVLKPVFDSDTYPDVTLLRFTLA